MDKNEQSIIEKIIKVSCRRNHKKAPLCSLYAPSLKFFFFQGRIVEQAGDCTYLVADEVKRTVKFLSGLSVCRYVMKRSWLHACAAAGLVFLFNIYADLGFGLMEFSSFVFVS